MEGDEKKCSRCHKIKIQRLDFYMCQGKWRSECKTCTIKKNTAYQKKTKAWTHRFVDSQERKAYMMQYYAANKEKFAAYRDSFKNKNPEYHKLYARKKKNERQ